MKNKGQHRDKNWRGGKIIREAGTGAYLQTRKVATVLATWVPQKRAHHDDDGYTQASVCWADRLPPFPLSPLVPLSPLPSSLPLCARALTSTVVVGYIYVSLWHEVYADDNNISTRRARPWRFFPGFREDQL